MKIWEEEEFLNIRNLIIFFILYSWAFIILLLVNFILEKSFTNSTNVYSYFEKGKKYISTYKSQCFKEVYDFMLEHTHCSAGPHAARGPQVGQPCCKYFNSTQCRKTRLKTNGVPCFFNFAGHLEQVIWTRQIRWVKLIFKKTLEIIPLLNTYKYLSYKPFSKPLSIFNKYLIKFLS